MEGYFSNSSVVFQQVLELAERVLAQNSNEKYQVFVMQHLLRRKY